jgi:hypothetical protein
MFYYLASNLGPQNHVVSRILKDWGLFFGGIKNEAYIMQETDNFDVESSYRHMMVVRDHAISMTNVEESSTKLLECLTSLSQYRKYCLCNISLLPLSKVISELNSSLIIIDYPISSLKEDVFFDMVSDETYLYYQNLISKTEKDFLDKNKSVHRVDYLKLKNKEDDIEVKKLKNFVESNTSKIDFDIIDFENTVCKNLLINMFNEE